MPPNLLATRRGRMAAFFLFYVIEGIPYGLAGVVVATQLRRQGVGPAEIGAFVALFFLPLTLKWAYAPFVDVFRSRRFGHRRGWIILAQVLMASTMLALVAVPMPSGLAIFTAILLAHSAFAAIHDVAVDSLAVNLLAEKDRGVCNGVMFAGAILGQSIGGAGVLFMLSNGVPLQAAFVAIAAAILSVTIFIVLPMKEPAVGTFAPAQGVGRWRAVRDAMRTFAAQSFMSFMGTSGAFRGVFFTLLPAGAMALGSALSSNLSVEFGMKDDDIGALNLWTSIIAAAAMVVGGWLSDRFGHRRTLAIYLAGMSLPVLYLMWAMQAHDYVMPRVPGGPPLPDLLRAFWVSNIAYAAIGGMMVGTRAAIMMDVTNPRVAATQFTAYMAMINIAMAVGASWQGLAAETWGYPITLLVDALTGLLCIFLLPAMKRVSVFKDANADKRARRSSLALGIACMSWLLYWPNQDMLGKGHPIMGTFYTLVFVAGALFLLASREVLGNAAGAWRRGALWVAPLLLAMHGRHWIDQLEGMPALHSIVLVLLYGVPLAGGIVLLALASRDWQGASVIESEPGLSQNAC